MPFITLYRGRITNGSSTCTMATYTAKRVKIMVSGASTMCSDCRSVFTGPSRWSRMNQAVVRTRIEVQKGTSTSAIATLAHRCDGTGAGALLDLDRSEEHT